MGRKPAFGRGPPSTPCANRLHTREQDVYDGRRCSYSITLVPHEEPGCLHYTGVPTGGGGGTPSTSCVRRPKCVSRAEGHGVAAVSTANGLEGKGGQNPVLDWLASYGVREEEIFVDALDDFLTMNALLVSKMMNPLSGSAPKAAQL